MGSFKKVHSFARDVRGLSAVEYALLLVLVSVGGIKAWTTFGKDLVKKVDDSSKSLSSATGPTSSSK